MLMKYRYMLMMNNYHCCGRHASPACCNLLTSDCILLSLILMSCSIFCIFSSKIYLKE